MSEYRLVRSRATGEIFVQRVADGAMIPNAPGDPEQMIAPNPDWLIYQEWLAAGNEPDPVRLPAPTVELPQPTTLEMDAQGDMDAVTLRQLEDRIHQLEERINHGSSQ